MDGDKVNGSSWNNCVCGEAISRVLTVRQGVPACLTRLGVGGERGTLVPGVQPSWSPHAAMAAGHSHCPGHGPLRKMGEPYPFRRVLPKLFSCPAGAPETWGCP